MMAVFFIIIFGINTTILYNLLNQYVVFIKNQLTFSDTYYDIKMGIMRAKWLLDLNPDIPAGFSIQDTLGSDHMLPGGFYDEYLLIENDDPASITPSQTSGSADAVVFITIGPGVQNPANPTDPTDHTHVITSASNGISRSVTYDCKNDSITQWN